MHLSTPQSGAERHDGDALVVGGSVPSSLLRQPALDPGDTSGEPGHANRVVKDVYVVPFNYRPRPVIMNPVSDVQQASPSTVEPPSR